MILNPILLLPVHSVMALTGNQKSVQPIPENRLLQIIPVKAITEWTGSRSGHYFSDTCVMVLWNSWTQYVRHSDQAEFF